MRIALPKLTAAEAISDNLTHGQTFTGGLSRRPEDLMVFNQTAITGIATDKLRYPIREIASNAWDANRKRAFDIHLPTEEEPWFSVRDYGKGIKPQRYGDYIMIGRSTKRNDDKVAGCLGFGSKSPYAYLLSSEQTPEYTVTSITDGMRRVYLHSLNQHFAPQAVLVAEEPTTEEPGLEVSWPIAAHDIDAVRQAAEEIIGMFPEPHCRTVGINDFIDIGDGLRMSEDAGELWVRMGCVAYPSGYNAHCNIIVDVPIGAVSITSSRERLGEDDATKRYLETLHKQTIERIQTMAQARVDAAVNRRAGILALPKRWREYLSHYDYFYVGGIHVSVTEESICFARPSTGRIADRKFVLGARGLLYRGDKDMLPALQAYGFHVTDLTKAKLPKVEKKKGTFKRRVIDRNGDETKTKTITFDPETMLLIYAGSHRYSRSELHAAYDRHSISDQFHTQFLADFPQIEAMIVVERRSDPLCEKGINLADFIEANTQPPRPQLQVPHQWPTYTANSNKLKILAHVAELPALKVKVEEWLTYFETQIAGHKHTSGIYDQFHPSRPNGLLQWPEALTSIPKDVEEIMSKLNEWSLNSWEALALEYLNDRISRTAGSGDAPAEGQDDLDTGDGPALLAAA